MLSEAGRTRPFAASHKRPLPGSSILAYPVCCQSCNVIEEYPLKFWKRRRKTTGIHDRNLASEYLIGNKPDRQGSIESLRNGISQSNVRLLSHRGIECLRELTDFLPKPLPKENCSNICNGELSRTSILILAGITHSSRTRRNTAVR